MNVSPLLMGERDFPSATAFNLFGLDMDDLVRRLSGRSPYGGGYLSLDEVCREMWCIAEQLEAEVGLFLDAADEHYAYLKVPT